MTIDLPCSGKPRVSIIIVASSGLSLLRACLQSLARFAPAMIPFETILVLNAATPDIEPELRAMVTGVRITGSAVNLGLAGAANRGRSLARGEFLLLLHDDAEVEAGWMEALVATADAHPEAGAIGGMVLHPDGRLQSVGMILWSDAHSSPPWVGDAPPPGVFNQLRAVDYCGSSSLLVRASAWDAVGGLEERLYPVYCIDVDLSMALRRLGFVVLCQPASRIRHHQGASGNLRFRTFASERNRRLLIEKWGKALEAYEPPARQAAPAIDRATARAQSRWNERLRDGPPAIAPAPARAALDPSQQEFRLAETSRAFQRAYIEHLTKALEDAEEQLKQGEEERSRQDRILRSRSAMVRRLAAMLVFGKPRT